MSTFKIGDRVKVVNDEAVAAYNGRTGTVTSVEDPSRAYPIQVKFDVPVALRGDVTSDGFDPVELALLPVEYDTSVAGVLRTAIANLDPHVDDAVDAVNQAFAALTAAQDKRDDLVGRRDALTRALTAVQEPTP